MDDVVLLFDTDNGLHMFLIESTDGEVGEDIIFVILDTPKFIHVTATTLSVIFACFTFLDAVSDLIVCK